MFFRKEETNRSDTATEPTLEQIKDIVGRVCENPQVILDDPTALATIFHPIARNLISRNTQRLETLVHVWVEQTKPLLALTDMQKAMLDLRGVCSRNGKNRTLSLSQRPEFVRPGVYPTNPSLYSSFGGLGLADVHSQ